MHFWWRVPIVSLSQDQTPQRTLADLHAGAVNGPMHSLLVLEAPFSLSYEEAVMTRQYIDCREYPSEMHCTVAISAESDDELLEAAVQHAVSVHGHEDTPEFRQQLKSLFHEGAPSSKISEFIGL